MIFLQNLVKKYAGRTILGKVSYHFPEGAHIALVGPNGAGKTTLLDIITGHEAPDDGEVVRPKKVVIGYLPQEPNPNPKPTIVEECMDGAYNVARACEKRDAALVKMGEAYSDEIYEEYEKYETIYQNLGGYSLESEAKGYLMGLGFTQAQFDMSPENLSGGWRMRLELVRVLINKPDFLILDEPTNHLDLPSMIWLENYLKTFKGTLVFVSHDRDLLNRLSNWTLHLNNGMLTPYKGNFDAFLEQSELKQLQNESEAKNIQKQYEHIEKFVSRFRASPSKARMVQSRLKVLARLKTLEGSIVFDEDMSELSIPLKTDTQSGKVVMTLQGGSIGYDKPLAKQLNLKIERGQKIAIIGANGIGKSTLLKSIVGNIPLLGGELTFGTNVLLGHYTQDQVDALDLKKTVLENLQASNPDIPHKHARALLGGFLFRRDDVFKKCNVLSGGEKSRLGLCCLLGQKANFLLLDEPTNHLDMSSAESLAQALEEFNGTVLFVSHNRAFINEVATHIFAMTPDGRGGLFPGKLEDYERLSERAGFPNVLKLDDEIEHNPDG
jgi:ATP-binding cassette subfamily F protein 3